MRASLAAAIIATGALTPGWAVAQEDAPAEPPVITLTAVVREFTPAHPDFRGDFGGSASTSPGQHAGIVADQLGPDGKPEFISGGYPVLNPATDGAGAGIIGPRRYIEARPGDSAPKLELVEGRAVTSAESLSAWYRDVAGVNTVALRSMDLLRDVETGTYIFEERIGFGPDRLRAAGDIGPAPTGAGAGRGTCELRARFTHQAGAGDSFRFAAAGDLWVYVGDRLVVDLGGMHERREQVIELDRLPWLRDGLECQVSIFFAQRGAEAAPLRIETTVVLEGPGQPSLATVSE